MITDKLIDRILDLQNPSVVGLDPKLAFVPEWIKREAFAEFGKTPSGAAKAFYMYNQFLIDAVCDIVPAVKPQVAMYEQLGAPGVACYIDTIAYAKQKGLIVIGDVKRGDIATTAEAYADGHIGRVDIEGEAFDVYGEDYITINAYLGTDSVAPYLPNCKRYDKGLFVLVKTSNPNSGEIQDRVAGGAKIYETVGDFVEKWGGELIGKHGFSAVGAVVGATHPEQAADLRKRMPHTFFLVPGYGAQGGKAEDLKLCFNEKGLGAVVNSSRGIIAAHQSGKYKDVYDEKEFWKAARAAALDMKKDLEQCWRR